MGYRPSDTRTRTLHLSLPLIALASLLPTLNWLSVLLSSSTTSAFFSGNYGMDILTTVPPPRLPSKVKKLAMGGSRAARALRMSCARSPPTTAQTGDSSCAAVVAMALHTPANRGQQMVPS